MSIIFPFVFVAAERELILITENMNSLSLIRLSNNVPAIITTMDK